MVWCAGGLTLQPHSTLHPNQLPKRYRLWWQLQSAPQCFTHRAHILWRWGWLRFPTWLPNQS